MTLFIYCIMMDFFFRFGAIIDSYTMLCFRKKYVSFPLNIIESRLKRSVLIDTKSFPIVAVPIYTSISSVGVFQLLPIAINPWQCLLFSF